MNIPKFIPHVVLFGIIIFLLTSHRTTSEGFETNKTLDDKATELLKFTKMINRLGDNVYSVKETFMTIPRYLTSFIPRPRLSIW